MFKIFRLLTKFMFVTIVLAIVFVMGAGYFIYKTYINPRALQSTNVCVKNACFEVEVADNMLTQAQGLMNRDSLDSNKGMLFVFSKAAIYPFWMKNTLIPLDIIWIDENNKIVFIKSQAEPCKDGDECSRITPDAKAKYVLEIAGGRAKEINAQIGDQVDIQLSNK